MLGRSMAGGIKEWRGDDTCMCSQASAPPPPCVLLCASQLESCVAEVAMAGEDRQPSGSTISGGCRVCYVGGSV